MADREIMRLSAQETVDWLNGTLAGTWTDRIHDPQIRERLERQRRDLRQAVWTAADAFIMAQRDFSPESSKQMTDLKERAVQGDERATHHMIVMMAQLINIAFGWEQM